MNEDALIPLSPDGNEVIDRVPRLEPTVTRIRKLGTAFRKHFFETAYGIGGALVKGLENVEDAPFFGDEQKYRKYLQQATGLDHRDLHDFQRLVTSYTREAFDKLVKHEHVSWTHIRQLIRAPAKARRKLEKQLIDEKWSTRDLSGAVQKLNESTEETPGSETHGRPPNPPKDAGQCLRQITKANDSWLEKCDSVWFGDQFDVRAKIADLPAQELDEKVALELAKAETLLQEVARSANERAANLRDLQKLVRMRIEDARSGQEAK